MRMDYDIAVIGAGASGMTAAVAAARKGCRVCLLEALPRAGKKLLATGNGRCNISNRNVSAESCRTDAPKLVKNLYREYSPQKIWDFLSSVGIELMDEEEGRMYPRSGQASSVLDMLRFELERLGASVICDAEVTKVQRQHGGFRLHTASQSISACRVIFANGSKASPQLGGSDSGVRMLKAFGHTSAPMRPSLVPLRCNSAMLRSLKGVRVRCRASVACQGRKLYEDNGEVQFADQMISGIVVFQLSARLARAGVQEAQLQLDLMPEKTAEQVAAMLSERRSNQGYLTLENFLSGIFNKKIGICLIKAISDLPMTEQASVLTEKQIKQLANNIKVWSFTVQGAASWQHAQCMSGGIRLGEFGTDLQSRIVPGVYACGELLDCDCDCGGYNLHWAWTSGIAAGENAAASLNEEQY